jgi:integrase
MKKKRVVVKKAPKRYVGLKYLTTAEQDAFMGIITDPRDHLIFQLMLRQGLRVGEVVGEILDYWTKNGYRIKDSDVPENLKDLKANTPEKVGEDVFVRVHQELEGIHLEDIDWVEKRILIRGKGDKQRFIPLRPDILEELTKYIQPTELAPEERTGKLFEIDPPTVRYHCKKYAELAKIPRRVHPHMMRHTFAYNYLKYDGKIRALQIILGHASLAVTERYLQWVEEEVKNDVAKVDMAEDMRKNPEQAKRDLAKKISDAIIGG